MNVGGEQCRVGAEEAMDFTHSSVPMRARRDSLTMGLLWITMVTGFPTVLTGFSWFKEGLTLPQVLTYALVSCGIMMMYFVPACWLGARSGLTYCLLSRKVFGAWGSRLVSFNLVWIAMCWYGLTAIFMAEGLQGIYHLDIPLHWLAMGFAVLMAFNNFFGFSGVANFARYAAGPILILWVGFTFFKAVTVCPSTVWTEPATVSGARALTLVSAFVIGYAAWGNEADYWRFGKPSVKGIALPLAVALAVGQFIFPVTGWMLARISGVSEYGAATRLMDNFAFGGISLIAALVLVVCYFAVNDSCLYGAITALENVKQMSRRKVVAWLTLAGVIASGLLANVTKNFEQIASVSCIFLPSATIIILLELFVLSRSSMGNDAELKRVPTFEELPAVRWSAVASLVLGCAVGVMTAGIVPGTDSWHVGVPALQAWITCMVSYVVLRKTVDRRSASADGPSTCSADGPSAPNANGDMVASSSTK
jgi:cytosine permease